VGKPVAGCLAGIGKTAGDRARSVPPVTGMAAVAMYSFSTLPDGAVATATSGHAFLEFAGTVVAM
jgi:hypothetical protein